MRAFEAWPYATRRGCESLALFSPAPGRTHVPNTLSLRAPRMCARTGARAAAVDGDGRLPNQSRNRVRVKAQPVLLRSEGDDVPSSHAPAQCPGNQHRAAADDDRYIYTR